MAKPSARRAVRTRGHGRVRTALPEPANQGRRSLSAGRGHGRRRADHGAEDGGDPRQSDRHRQPRRRRRQHRHRVRGARARRRLHARSWRTGSTTINNTLTPNLTWDLARDFTPVVQFAWNQSVLVVYAAAAGGQRGRPDRVGQVEAGQDHGGVLRGRQLGAPVGGAVRDEGGRGLDPRAVQGHRTGTVRSRWAARST